MSKMNLLPGTGIRVSPICLGTMTFGSPLEEKEAVRLLNYAYDTYGLNFIDTANMYEGYNRYAGSPGGVAEEIVGKAVSSRRDQFVIATKVGMKVGVAPEDENTSPDAIRVQLRRSLKRLGTDYVDLYYLHRFDPETAPEEIVRAIGAEIKAGLIRAWGFSNYTYEQAEALWNAAKNENIPLPSVCQPAYSLLNAVNAEKLIPLCVKNGIGIIPYQLLQGGLLTGKYRRNEKAPEGSRMAEKPEWMKPLTEESWNIIENTVSNAAQEGLTPVQYVLKDALRMEGTVSALLGFKRQEQIDEAARIL